MKQLVLITLLATAISLLFAVVILADTVTDIDGNVYQTVVIGNQVWMAENLKVTHYSNGDSIPIVIVDSASWTGLTTGAACAFNNDENNVSTYGRMYNWFAGADPRNLAPTGWHVPTDSDWVQLELFLGMPADRVWDMGNRGGSPVGAKLKEVGSVHWNCPNSGTTNETGFTALPGGVLDNRPVFNSYRMDALFWTSTQFTLSPTAGWARSMTCNLVSIARDPFGRDYGASVRCIRNAPAGVEENGDSELPNGFQLTQNYPNPFNPTTLIQFDLPKQSRVVLEIFNILGQKIRTLVDDQKAAGLYRVEWNGNDDSGNAVPSGIYTYRIKAGVMVWTKKMSLLK
jgi:uncharacterized protein (TIGR02145 family)